MGAILFIISVIYIIYQLTKETVRTNSPEFKERMEKSTAFHNEIHKKMNENYKKRIELEKELEEIRKYNAEIEARKNNQ